MNLKHVEILRSHSRKERKTLSKIWKCIGIDTFLSFTQSLWFFWSLIEEKLVLRFHVWGGKGVMRERERSKSLVQAPKHSQALNFSDWKIDKCVRRCAKRFKKWVLGILIEVEKGMKKLLAKAKKVGTTKLRKRWV